MTDDGFAAEYLSYRQFVLRPLAVKASEIFDEWRTPGYWQSYREFPISAIPTPIQRVRTRIKRLESVVDKFRRMPDEFPGPPNGDNLSRLRDAFGARIITFFPSHLAMVDAEIRASAHLELSSKVTPKSYLSITALERAGIDPASFRGTAGPKPSGYASLHYTVRLRDPFAEENPWFELQTRTMLEEIWGEVEHQIAYKPDQHTTFSVKRQFRVISDQLSALDSHFDFLYSELAFQQATTMPSDQDLLNTENLPRVLHDLECVVVQKEIDGLLRILGDYDITTVSGLIAIGRIELVEAIKSELAKHRPLHLITAFDIVPVLVLLNHRSSPDDARKVVRTHLALSEQNRRERG